MNIVRKIILIHLIFLPVFFISGCASLAKFVLGKDGLKVPQIVAHLEPFLADNKITIRGKIIIQNPTEGSLDLDKIYLEFRDEDKDILEKTVLDWERPTVTSRQELEAPVTINLGLEALNKESISVFIRTGFTYKALGLHIPIESNVAVLHLGALEESISQPLSVNFSTNLHSTIFGNSSVDYVLDIATPLSVDLILEEGVIRIYTLEGRDIAKGKFPRTLLAGSQANHVEGTIKIGNIWRQLIRSEAMRRRPLKFQVSGNLRIPKTSIFIPFKVESAIEVSLSFFGR